MKKMIVTLAIMVTALTSFAGEEKVDQKVLQAFNTEFATAGEAIWTVGENYYKVEFLYNEQHVFAYYSLDAELLGLSRYISPRDLPVYLQTKLKANYKEYWVADLFEVAKDESTSYYVTLENADTKLVLRSSGGGDWKVYRKVKKA